MTAPEYLSKDVGEEVRYIEVCAHEGTRAEVVLACTAQVSTVCCDCGLVVA